MLIADAIGWLGTAMMVQAAIWVAHKQIRGLWMMLAGNVAFICVGYLSSLSSLIAVSILMGSLDYYGIVCWRRDERNKTT